MSSVRTSIDFETGMSIGKSKVQEILTAGIVRMGSTLRLFIPATPAVQGIDEAGKKDECTHYHSLLNLFLGDI